MMLDLLEAIEDGDIADRPIPCAGLLLRVAKEIDYVVEYDDDPGALYITKRGLTFLKRVRK